MQRIALRAPRQIGAEEEQTALEAGMSRAAAEVVAVAAETVALSEEDQVDIADQALARQAVVARQAWDPEEAVGVAADGADKPSHTPKAEHRRTA
jgi:hypothetical protein